MTDKEKLQKLFDAALRDQSLPVGGAPKRAFPETTGNPQSPEPLTPPEASFQAAISTPAASVPVPQINVAAVLDDSAAMELGALLDDQIRRKASKRRREALVTAVVLFGLTGGGFAWFVQSPTRVEAFTSAIREIRSVGDVKAIVAKYQAALDRIGARSRQMDQATAAMGVDPAVGNYEDPNFNAEMKEMMGGEGKTVGERNQALEKSFGDKAKEHGGIPKTTVALKEGETFEWKQ